MCLEEILWNKNQMAVLVMIPVDGKEDWLQDVWEVRRSDGWEVGKLDGWEVGRLDGWEVGRLVSWEVEWCRGWQVLEGGVDDSLEDGREEEGEGWNNGYHFFWYSSCVVFFWVAAVLSSDAFLYLLGPNYRQSV